MTNTELIRQEIEKRIALYDTLADAAAEKNLHNTLEANELLINTYKGFLSFIDSLPEEDASSVLVEDSDYQVVHTTVYGCGDEMSPEISVELDDMFKPNEEVKVIVVKKRKK